MKKLLFLSILIISFTSSSQIKNVYNDIINGKELNFKRENGDGCLVLHQKFLSQSYDLKCEKTLYSKVNKLEFINNNLQLHLTMNTFGGDVEWDGIISIKGGLLILDCKSQDGTKFTEKFKLN
jgi:hypothetical protein